MRYECRIHVGPAIFRIGSDWAQPIEQLKALYQPYPDCDDAIADFTIRLEAQRFYRRWFRPSVRLSGDYMLPDASPLPLTQGLLAAEMAMNLQMALGWRRHLLLHASAVERDGKVLLMTGESGSGKSTLSALLAEHGWRFLGDEFALVDLDSGDIQGFPRAISLKNSAIDVARDFVGDDARFGPLLTDTPKGAIRHLQPPESAIAAMGETAMPALLLYPSFGYPRATDTVPPTENFVRLTQASTNYVALGEAGFSALVNLVQRVPAHAIDFETNDEALELVEALWARVA
ncbi:HprK-related kinase A [Alterisphingorhabdus coralli]|uniref:HprK-related kinase A n=1 Tax=Alterisphingorhabdus coralli TaxID=3071408 RepID=A0AA97F573_9SPHN|nr:HprK-related kinase A [Parasphingorhabdus sp. SCSIO 66989]WOE74233.1 HprK-related kinase A [Parasphingorhabdus sp. SCSIO 66989]